MKKQTLTKKYEAIKTQIAQLKDIKEDHPETTLFNDMSIVILKSKLISLDFQIRYSKQNLYN